MSYKKNHYPASRKKHEEPKPIREDVFYINPGVDKNIYTSQLTSGLPYQRPVDEKEVARLIKEWDERLFDPLSVSFRDGKFNVVDGQHRVAALRRMNEGTDVLVACKVYSGMNYKQEADFCYKLDKAKKRLSLSQSTNALAESGTDAEISTVKMLVEQCGFTWALNRKTGRTGEITATRAILNAYRLLGGATFTRMLELLRATWNGSHQSVTAFVLSGMALFMKTYDTEMDDGLFMKRLSLVDPDEIIRRGKADISTSKTAIRCARVLLEKYNGQRGGRRLPYRFKG